VKFESQRNFASRSHLLRPARYENWPPHSWARRSMLMTGFLRKIRVAEFQPGRTRVVLEVDDLASYNAFLLPNPYRLIIDVHGKQVESTLLAKANPAHAPPAAAERRILLPMTMPQSNRPINLSKRNVRKGSPGKQASPPSPTTVQFSKAEAGKDKDKLEGASQHPDALQRRLRAASRCPASEWLKTTVPVAGTNRKIPKTHRRGGKIECQPRWRRCSQNKASSRGDAGATRCDRRIGRSEVLEGGYSHLAQKEPHSKHCGRYRRPRSSEARPNRIW